VKNAKGQEATHFRVRIKIYAFYPDDVEGTEAFSATVGGKWHGFHETIKFVKALAHVGAVFTKLTLDNPDAIDSVHDAYYNEEKLEELQRWPK